MQICGLKWSPDDRELASGGNDNQLFIWGLNNTSPVIRFSDHQAAVKALAWSPHQHGLIASGGGTADRCIRFWNTATASPLNCIDTGAWSSLIPDSDECEAKASKPFTAGCRCIPAGPPCISGNSHGRMVVNGLCSSCEIVFSQGAENRCWPESSRTLELAAPEVGRTRRTDFVCSELQVDPS